MEEIKQAIEELKQVKDKVLDIKFNLENEQIYHGDDVNKPLNEAIDYMQGIAEGVDYATDQLEEAKYTLELIEYEKRVWA